MKKYSMQELKNAMKSDENIVVRWYDWITSMHGGYKVYNRAEKSIVGYITTNQFYQNSNDFEMVKRGWDWEEYGLKSL